MMSTEEEMEYQSYPSASVNIPMSSARRRSVSRRRDRSLNSVHFQNLNRTSKRAASTPKPTRPSGRTLNQSSTNNQLSTNSQSSTHNQSSTNRHVAISLLSPIHPSNSPDRSQSPAPLLPFDCPSDDEQHQQQNMHITTRSGKMKKDTVLSYFTLRSDGQYDCNTCHQTLPLIQHATTNAVLISRNNVQPIESPMRRPHPSSNDELSETESFMNDISTRTVHNHKRTRLNASKLHQQQPTITTSVHTSLNNRTHVTTTIYEVISIEAERFAQSRYPFPPFIIRFATPNIKKQTVAEGLRKHLKQHNQLDIEFVGYRRSKNKCSNNEIDILLFVKDSYSFACLFDDSNWPTLLNGEMFVRSHKPPIPPQLSLIIKNVGLNIDWVRFSNELKSNYSGIVNIIRMKNKKYENIKLIKIEFDKPEQRNNILLKGKIIIECLLYEVEEYLAPAKDFPSLPSAQKSTIQGYKTNNHSNNNNGAILSKLNEMNQNMSKVNVILEKSSSTNAKFEQFMANVIEQDKKVEMNIQDLQKNGQTMMSHITQLQVYSTRHENLFKKVFLPIIDDLSKFMLSMNRDKHDRVVDADFGVTLERLRTQLNNALEGKDSC
ncbi:unnamed protein product [Rotaria sordida]|uniref:Uncharacterized protein n=1 Tax=Rotaria sordida TaxID=392033 RepID=A0A819NJH4_9BILA|nr:unnamed protein product [Rotaria sordida]